MRDVFSLVVSPAHFQLRPLERMLKADATELFHITAAGAWLGKSIPIVMSRL
jgi:hypothetical protein